MKLEVSAAPDRSRVGTQWRRYPAKRSSGLGKPPLGLMHSPTKTHKTCLHLGEITTVVKRIPVTRPPSQQHTHSKTVSAREVRGHKFRPATRFPKRTCHIPRGQRAKSALLRQKAC